MYGNIYNKLKNKLILFYLIVISFVIASASRSLLLTLLSAFILGMDMAFVPFLQENRNYGNKGTTLLVFKV